MFVFVNADHLNSPRDMEESLNDMHQGISRLAELFTLSKAKMEKNNKSSFQ